MQAHAEPTRPDDPHAAMRRWANQLRHRGDARGHYESYFVRANHPSRPLGFWMRYTLLSPRAAPEAALGELWGMFFDGERSRIWALREARPLSQCAFGADELSVQIGAGRLGEDTAVGELEDPVSGEHLRWQLAYSQGDEPLLLLPERLYAGGFPKAKTLVPAPSCRFSGVVQLRAPGEPTLEEVVIDGWIGSQNHNWGSKHTDAYAWVQCAGFDDAEDSFLECAIARLKLGPVWSPAITVMTLRHGDQSYVFDDLLRGAMPPSTYRFGAAASRFSFSAESRSKHARVRVQCEAPREDFVALTYLDPPGGRRICLNTKLADCEVTLERDGYAPVVLRSARRTAFEILADDACGLPLRV